MGTVERLLRLRSRSAKRRTHITCCKLEQSEVQPRRLALIRPSARGRGSATAPLNPFSLGEKVSAEADG
jgi:hypothetical protein